MIPGNQPDGTLVVAREKRSLSTSQIDMLSKCGEMYRRRYILGQRLPSTISMMVGIAVDNVVTFNLDKKAMSGELMEPDKVHELTLLNYRRAVKDAKESDAGILFKQSELLEGKEASIAEGEKKALRMTRLHSENVAMKLSPIHVQRALRVELPGYPFNIGGVIDIQEIDSVRDTKTKNRTPVKDIADIDDQLTVYALLVYFNDGAIPPRLILDCLIDNKTPVYKPFESTRTEADFDVYLNRIAVACEAIEAGIFVPARESDWWCGKDSCGYWPNCKYVKRSQRPTS